MSQVDNTVVRRLAKMLDLRQQGWSDVEILEFFRQKQQNKEVKELCNKLREGKK